MASVTSLNAFELPKLSSGKNSDGSDFWVPRIRRKMGLRQVEPGFSLVFCQIFGIVDDFSKFRAIVCSTLENSSNMANI